MPILNNIPVINGVQWAWGNIKVNLFGTPVVGITEIDYGRTQKKENLYGYGQEAVGRGLGNIENKASLSIYWDEWRKIIKAAPSRDPLAILPFDITVIFGNSALSSEQDVLRFCEFENDPFSAKQGDTKLLVKLDLIVGKIEH